MKAIIDGVEYKDVCVEFCESSFCPNGCPYCECDRPECIAARAPKEDVPIAQG